MAARTAGDPVNCPHLGSHSVTASWCFVDPETAGRLECCAGLAPRLPAPRAEQGRGWQSSKGVSEMKAAQAPHTLPCSVDATPAARPDVAPRARPPPLSPAETRSRVLAQHPCPSCGKACDKQGSDPAGRTRVKNTAT